MQEEVGPAPQFRGRDREAKLREPTSAGSAESVRPDTNLGRGDGRARHSGARLAVPSHYWGWPTGELTEWRHTITEVPVEQDRFHLWLWVAGTATDHNRCRPPYFAAGQRHRVAFPGEDLSIGSVWRAVKAKDLQRDPRYALHANPGDRFDGRRRRQDRRDSR